MTSLMGSKIVVSGIYGYLPANINSPTPHIYCTHKSSLSFGIRTFHQIPIGMISRSWSESDSTTKSSSIRSSSSVSLDSEVSNRPKDTGLNSRLESDDRVNRELGYETEEPTSSSQQPVSSTRKSSWKDARAARKTSRRRALAICLALATLTQHAPNGEQQANSAAVGVEAKDLITISTASGGESVSASPAIWEGYGDLVTVSTGSPNSAKEEEEGWVSYRGGDFRVRVPLRWVESNAEIATGSVLRYEDKENPSTNVIVLKSPTSQSRTDDLGNPEDWIREQAYLLTGSNEPLQFQSGDEGIDAAEKFPSGRVSIVKVLNVDKPKNKQGLTYYTYEIVTKQGGKPVDSLHELVSAVVNDGNLYMCRVQTEEGQWQQSTQSMAQRIVDSFQITGFKIRV